MASEVEEPLCQWCEQPVEDTGITVETEEDEEGKFYLATYCGFDCLIASA